MQLKAVAISVVILLMFMNATPALMVQSGVAEDMGIQPSVGGDTRIDQANENISDVSASGGLAPTLFQLFKSVTDPVQAVVNVVFAGPSMLMALGLPAWLVTFMFAPMYLITGGTIVYVLAGRVL